MKKKSHNNIYTIFIKNKTIKNKIKKIQWKKSWKKKKKEKSYLNIVANEAKEREKIRKAY
jgi:Ni,Fe-hydrogenase I cytochrome b subunit